MDIHRGLQAARWSSENKFSRSFKNAATKFTVVPSEPAVDRGNQLHWLNDYNGKTDLPRTFMLVYN
jgi:hypothetical protein